MSNDIRSMQAELEKLRAENAGLAKQNAEAKAEADRLAALTRAKLSVKFTVKGGISIYGLGRFPVTVYPTQLQALVEFMPTLLREVEANKAVIAKNAAVWDSLTPEQKKAHDAAAKARFEAKGKSPLELAVDEKLAAV